MRLKLTLLCDGGRPSADLAVTVDPNTTVAELANYLARSEPGSSVEQAASYTLRYPGRASTDIRPEMSIADSHVRSGSTVALTRADGRFIADPAGAATAVVHVVSGPDSGREYSIPPGTSVVGRGRDCDVRLTDPMTSRRHAKIHVGEVVEITDLGSVNGVRIGDAQTDTAVLRAGDTAQLGDTVISVRFKATSGAGGRNEGLSNGSPAAPGDTVVFNRPPRIEPRYEGRSFSLPDVPSAPRVQRFP